MTDYDTTYQVNGSPWRSLYTKEADTELAGLSDQIYQLVSAGVVFGALDHYASTGEYKNIKFRHSNEG